MRELTPSVFVETGFKGSNNTFVVTSDGVVVIDTPLLLEDGARWRDIIREHGPVAYVINTEPHRDHTAGNVHFDCAVVAHEGTRRAVINTPPMKTFQPRPPVITFSHDLTLYVGSHTFRVLHTPGHTPYNVAVYIPKERVMVAGDTVMNNLLPGMHEALPYEWLDSLSRLQALGDNLIVPGHGEVCDTGYLAEMKANIQEQLDAVASALQAGTSPSEIMQTLSFAKRYPGPPPPPGAERDNLNRLIRILSGDRVS
jgi:cyclase